MPDAKKPPEAQEVASEPFGTGLGPDFKPFGTRIVIAPGKNQTKLKSRKKERGGEDLPSSKPEPEAS